mmetsp:Transcript_11096/g.12701  ORF Transcript_11096/g.12701 Transcript_11096/m.12701 type:complete len:401 (+) Transcript_11096:213-1415(+)
MVLRGAGIAPPSLKEAEIQVKKAQEVLDRAKRDLQEAQENVVLELKDDVIQQLSKDELITLVVKLRDRIETMEETEVEAEVLNEKARMELQNTLKQLACGGAAGAIARTTVAPIDRVKILMQTSHLLGAEEKNRSIFQSFRNIIKEEGVMKLWRGNLTNCVRVIPHTATQFVAYDKYKSLILSDGEKMTVPTRLLSGALSGMTAASVTHPMDVIRIRLQTQKELRGVVDAIKSVHAENGMRTFYKGYVPAMLSLSPFIAINFATMDTLKTWYFGEEKSLSKKELQKRNPFAILGLGAVAGIVAQTCCYPLDTVRRRMQLKGNNYSGTINAFSTILKDEGALGFYKGMSANALKVVPNNAIRFAAFDMLKTFMMTESKGYQEMKKRETAWHRRHSMKKNVQ